VSPRFKFFTKKDDSPDPKKYSDKHKSNLANTLTIPEAFDLLNAIESERIKILSENLLPTKESIIKSLQAINKIADDLDEEKIKLEDTKFKSVVENSKKIVVASLKREASIEVPLPRSTADLERLKNRMETMMNRFGEVSGSHSKILNAFMKKYAGRLKNEFELLSNSLKEIKSLMLEFEEQRTKIILPKNILQTLCQKTRDLNSKEEEIRRGLHESKNKKSELLEYKNRSKIMETSTEFRDASFNLTKLEEAEKETEELRKQLVSLFTPVTRALTKYSYGVNKKISEQIMILIKEPWTIFDGHDISSYISLLNEVRQGVYNEKIKLKDYEKVIQYLNIILNSLNKFQDKFYNNKYNLQNLRETNIKKVMANSDELRMSIKSCEESLKDYEKYLEELSNEIILIKDEVRNLLITAEDSILQVTKKKYHLLID
jgi:hypothetical protein